MFNYFFSGTLFNLMNFVIFDLYCFRVLHFLIQFDKLSLNDQINCISYARFDNNNWLSLCFNILSDVSCTPPA